MFSHASTFLDRPCEEDSMIGILAKGIIAIPHLEAFLGDRVIFRPTLPDKRINAIAGWGGRLCVRRELGIARRHRIEFLSLEDGFLGFSPPKSVRLTRMSMVVDRSGVYYEASNPSDLENILNRNGWQKPELLKQASEAIDAIMEHKLSRYYAPDVPSGLFAGNSEKVLVIDRSAGDGITHIGASHEKTFEDMIETARFENQRATLYVKPGFGKSKNRNGYPKRFSSYDIRFIHDEYASLSLLESIDKVYTITSHVGFEALLLGKTVRCFGMPFYAGWGLTRDELTCARRTEPRTIQEIFAAAYILYSRYVNPYTGSGCSFEDALDILVSLKKQDLKRHGLSVCVGFPFWKRPNIKPFLSSISSRTKFIHNTKRAVKDAKRNSGRIVVWASSEKPELEVMARTLGVDVVRMEDGFVRSVGLGSDFHAPYSLVLDEKGIYFDPARPSELECILEKGDFDPVHLERAKCLREKIVARGITKYNQGIKATIDLDLPTDSTVVLVPGQVESDASVLRGSFDIKTNLDLLKAVRETRPDAFIVYKPHPDVLVGNRPGRVSDAAALRFCNRVVGNLSAGTMLSLVAEVHTISSLTGFEALLRGKRVFTYGGPFYAGWGLTADRMKFPRRTRKVALDELVAAALIVYPSYYDPNTGLFCAPEVILDHLSEQLNSNRHVCRSFLSKSLRFILCLVSHGYVKRIH